MLACFRHTHTPCCLDFFRVGKTPNNNIINDIRKHENIFPFHFSILKRGTLWHPLLWKAETRLSYIVHLHCNLTYCPVVEAEEILQWPILFTRNNCNPGMVWVSNYIHYRVWDEITYPFPNFNGITVEDWEWISNFVPHFTGCVITYPYRDKRKCMLVKRRLMLSCCQHYEIEVIQ